MLRHVDFISPSCSWACFIRHSVLHVNEALRFIARHTHLAFHGIYSSAFIVVWFFEPFQTIDLLQKLQNIAKNMLVSSQLYKIYKLHAQIQNFYYVFSRKRVLVRVFLILFATGVIGGFYQENVLVLVQNFQEGPSSTDVVQISWYILSNVLRYIVSVFLRIGKHALLHIDGSAASTVQKANRVLWTVSNIPQISGSSSNEFSLTQSFQIKRAN